jgi:hypothetical protein
MQQKEININFKIIPISGKRLHGGIDSPRGGLVGTGPKVMVY